MTLDGVPLPWVKKVLHFGCTLDSDNSMQTDIALPFICGLPPELVRKSPTLGGGVGCERETYSSEYIDLLNGPRRHTKDCRQNAEFYENSYK